MACTYALLDLPDELELDVVIPFFSSFFIVLSVYAWRYCVFSSLFLIFGFLKYCSQCSSVYLYTLHQKAKGIVYCTYRQISFDG